MAVDDVVITPDASPRPIPVSASVAELHRVGSSSTDLCGIVSPTTDLNLVQVVPSLYFYVYTLFHTQNLHFLALLSLCYAFSVYA